MFDVARGWIFAERRPWILGSVHAGSGRSWQAWWILIEAIEAIEGLIKRSSWNHRFSFVIVKTKEDAGSPSFGPRRGVQSGVAARQIMGQSLSRSELTAPKRRDPDPFGMHLMRDDPWEGSGTRVGPQETPTTDVRRGSTEFWSQMLGKDPFGISLMQEADEACNSRLTTCADAKGTSIAVAAQAMVAERNASTERAKLTSIDEQSVKERRSERSSVTELRDRHIASHRQTDLASANALQLALATEQSANEEDGERGPESEAQEAQRNSATPPKQQPPSRQTDVASPRVTTGRASAAAVVPPSPPRPPSSPRPSPRASAGGTSPCSGSGRGCNSPERHVPAALARARRAKSSKDVASPDVVTNQLTSVDVGFQNTEGHLAQQRWLSEWESNHVDAYSTSTTPAITPSITRNNSFERVSQDGSPKRPPSKPALTARVASPLLDEKEMAC